MSHPRISLALDAFPPLPDGQILVLGARESDDLSDLAQDRLTVIRGFAPDFAVLKARGFSVFPAIEGLEATTFAAALIFLPRSKTEARAMIAQARARTKGPIWIDGGKTDGIDSILKDMRAAGEVVPPISKAHGKIFAAHPAGDLAEWLPVETSPAEGFVTRPGVFSEGKVDRGSQLLAAVLPPKLPSRVADLGAGWGWLSAQVLGIRGVDEVHLIEADYTALECARLNITDPRAQFHWADATDISFDHRFGAVVMNPPFHTTRDADPALGAAFIRAASKILSLSGNLYMVANRHLPYETALRSQFKEVEELFAPQASGARGPDGAFKLYRAAKPVIGR
ncbi:class I SAM-dependent methyltransferase [Albirhodobacter sp. R86504]|jgi:16S rRNA (guanine1207-N2)-methyltransferase|uniref:class I SAM-dependent methyltransferase n=1 Tax=Albirhodobacter sp. R86504 TaxID=3093848 RepID=UPI00366E85BD